MSETIKVRCTSKKGGFIYNRFRAKGDVFVLKPVTHSTETDNDDELKVISADKQFSSRWMELVGDKPTKSADPKKPSEMTAPELKAALTSEGVDIPDKTKKAGLLKLLEDHLADKQE